MFGRYYPQLFILFLGARLRPPRLGYGRGWPDPWELETGVICLYAGKGGHCHLGEGP